MKHFIAPMFIAALTLASQAKADGFICTSSDGSLTVKVYDHVTPAAGTRNAAVLVVSDNNVGAGNKTIARFTDVHRTLTNQGASYDAKVDLRFNDSGRKGELIGGTKLGQLANILLDVDFSFAEPVDAGDQVDGYLTLVKRDEQIITFDVVCTRYLKN